MFYFENTIFFVLKAFDKCPSSLNFSILVFIVLSGISNLDSVVLRHNYHCLCLRFRTSPFALVIMILKCCQTAVMSCSVLECIKWLAIDRWYLQFVYAI